jgi:D-arabinose 1-dehydrogenase-like Zn-dependent alcohol dehydrogenase
VSVENVRMPEPSDGQVLVRIGACGLKLGGADAAIALTVSHLPFEQAFDALARGGTLVMVARHSGGCRC